MTPPDDVSAPLLDSGPEFRTESSDPLWYKDAIIYQLHVKAFFDANDDGIGDFEGLRHKLDYLQDLGVTALWLLPFYPSPLRDDGYDISDYRNINPSYGGMHDFRMFVREAHRRDIRVITELVINHTSDQHPWFQRARRAKPGSRLRDFYVWSDTDQKFPETRIIFLDTEKSNWAWDPVAQAYYWHRFYAHQPDLNFDNPRVFRTVTDVMRFWLDQGVDGMRLDAVPYLIEREGTINENLPETREVLRRLRRELDTRYRDRMLLAEANQWPEDVLQYFGAGDECHMAFHFPLMPRIYMAIATEDRHPIADIIRQTPDIPETCQWAVFLRNHDELTLEMVTDRERDYLWNYYAADRRARLNLGIRRRLAPLMENDRRKIELLNALLISMPGTPVFYYGDEIGMGDNVFLGDRDGVRTPMQWSFDRNGGFSRADPARLYLPPIMDSVYGFEAVNVEAQSRSPSSLLNWLKRLIAARRSRRAFGRGTLRFLYPSNRKVIAYLRTYGDEIVLCVANLSRSPQAVELDLSDWRGRQPIELLGRSTFPPIGELPYMLTLQGYSFFWFELLPSAAETANLRAAPPELFTLVMPHGWADLFRQPNLPQLESDVVPNFLPRQRWFGAKDQRVKTATILARGEITRPAEEGTGPEKFLAEVVEAQLARGGRQRYFLPLATIWSSAESDSRQALIPSTLAELRQFRREGALVDALSQDGFSLALMEAIRQEATIPLEGGEIRCRKTPIFDQVTPPERLIVRRIGAEQSNSSMIFGDYGMLKTYRRLQPGPHPEIEMSRFLVERAGFGNTPPLLAFMELDLNGKEDAETHAVGVLFGFVQNQGDGWAQALDYLSRYLDDALVSSGERHSDLPDPDVFFLSLARQLGLRTAEMHRALAEKGCGDPDFAPEPITATDIAGWRRELDASIADMLSKLERGRARLAVPSQELADRLLAQRDNLSRLVRGLMPDEIEAQKIRYHGDFHLGQVIVVKNDFFIIDFEGEPARPLAERRLKSSPLRDVAGMIRSFDYASYTAVRQLAEARPAAAARMTQLAEAWRQRAVDGFRAAYRKAMRGCGAYPVSKTQARNMMAFFTLEKAVYEVSYELANRPGWVDIPLNGVLGILAKMEGLSVLRPRDPEVEAIVSATHGDPFSFLGMHKTAGGLCVRAMLPGVQEISVVDAATGKVAAKGVQIHRDGLFVANISDRKDPFRYRLRVSSRGAEHEFYDIYRFPPVLGELDIHLLAEGNHLASYRKLGAHPIAHEGVEGVAFAVWAPNARRVSVVGDFNSWDGRRMPMRNVGGFWELFVPGLRPGNLYKYEIIGAQGQLLPLKADPYAEQSERPPNTASVIAEPSRHVWQDGQWMAERWQRNDREAPISIYEVHLGSWRRNLAENGRYLTYRELAEQLVPYAADLGFTHIEIMPVTEYPFDGSWGYQPISLFAPTSRYGAPDDFRAFVDACHRAGLGLLLDWVPGHFPTDAHGLGRFDGTALYEHADPRQGFHPEWNTLIYNYGRREVANFLLSSALYLLREFHIDGIRVDAVASMLYLDYSRHEGQWIPNVFGGRENLEAIAFLRRMNELVFGEPGATSVAEESTAWPMVSRPTYVGGLGFGFKWNMGWMHDTLNYMALDPIHRKYHHNNLSFGLLYAFHENFILPLSHDEVVYGKGSLIRKMSGDRWQRFANLRAYLGFMWTHPGKKLLFMGGEFAQEREWNHDIGLDWQLLGEPLNGGISRLVRDLNHLYRSTPALHRLDCDPDGFRWIDVANAAESVVSYVRHGRDPQELAVIICNFTPVPRENYRIGVPRFGRYRERVNTDAEEYGGSGVGNAGEVHSEPHPMHGHPHSICLKLPPLGALIFTLD